MNEFKFKCPHCQQSLKCEDDLCGETIACPTCKTDFVVPAPQKKIVVVHMRKKIEISPGDSRTESGEA
ncbi:MAG: hypothetical protein PHR35_13715 [Kiritimatiellae bacterium]|nr:hypothetical protein [Kiritimatiellia bacterium]